PGVAGIGDKGAQKLLLEFGGVQALYDNLDSPKIPPKQRDLLQPLRDQVLLARKLTTIVTELPVELDAEQARLRDLRRPEVIGIFQELSFKSLIDRIPKLQPPPLPKNGRAQAGLFDALAAGEPLMQTAGRTITTLDELDVFVQQVRAHGSFAFNVQATGVLPMRAELVGIGLAAAEATAYIPVGHVSGDQLEIHAALDRLRPLFEDASLAK